MILNRYKTQTKITTLRDGPFEFPGGGAWVIFGETVFFFLLPENQDIFFRRVERQDIFFWTK